MRSSQLGCITLGIAVAVGACDSSSGSYVPPAEVGAPCVPDRQGCGCAPGLACAPCLRNYCPQLGACANAGGEGAPCSIGASYFWGMGGLVEGCDPVPCADDFYCDGATTRSCGPPDGVCRKRLALGAVCGASNVVDPCAPGTVCALAPGSNGAYECIEQAIVGEGAACDDTQICGPGLACDYRSGDATCAPQRTVCAP